MSKFDRIRKWYGIPVKRGVVAIEKGRAECGRVTSTDGSRVRVRWQGEKHSRIYHPLSLDYEIDGVKYSGDEYCERLNKRIDETNERWNRDGDG